MFLTRIVVGLMLFMASFTIYVVRTNISILLIAIVETSERKKAPNYGPRYDWSEVDQSSVIGAFYYGYAMSSLLGDILSEKFGARNIIAFMILISGILTIISPAFHGHHYLLIAVIRFIIGIFTGTCFSSCYNLISNWAPPTERSKFIVTLMGGGSLGSMVTFPVTTMLIQNFEWSVAFYVEGIFIVTFVPVWWLLVSNKPTTHWFINPDEVNYINETLTSTNTSSKKCPPYAKMFTSIPFLALIFLHFGNVWGLILMLSYAPKYMNQVLKYNFLYSGFLSSLPCMGSFTITFIAGSIGDYIMYNEILSITQFRKICCVPSHIIPGAIFLILAFCRVEPWMAVLLMTLSFSFNGATAIGHMQNFYDLAPNFAASLFGTTEFFGNMSGFLVPIMVAYFTKENNTQKEWSKIYMISGAIYIIPAMFFILLGTGKVQKWNYDQPTTDGNSNDEKGKK